MKGIQIIIDKCDKIKSFIKSKYKELKKNKKGISNFIKELILMTLIVLFLIALASSNIHNQGLFISFIIVIALFFITNKIVEVFNIYFNYLKEKENLNQLDLSLTGSVTNGTTENGELIQKPISQALDDHIEDILNSNILFFMNIPKNEYIRTNTEQEILNSLIDNVMKFTSKSFKKKISLYYGEENIDILIGRRCLIIVSLFVANHNKNIYISTPNMN